MKKNFLFWIMALMICAAVGCADNSTYEPEKLPTPKKMSHEVTQAEARKNLEKIIVNMKTSATRSGEQRSLPQITSVYTTGKPAEATRSSEVEPYFHIFNFGNNEGFAIMSGDDRVEPLLALTFSGEFTPETEIDNPGFKIAYSKMEDYYIAKTMGGPSVSPDIPIPPRDSVQYPDFELPVRYTEEYVEYYKEMPLGYCQVQWDQYEYNRYCFPPNSYQNAPTCCVATAMAQLMSIYKYPNNYNGYTFNWDYMLRDDLYTTGKDQIARLMQQLGLSNNLNVQYGSGYNGSTAELASIPPTFVNFGYANGGTKVAYSTSRVVQELTDGYPLLISGKDGTSTMGHTWLGHGLMELRLDTKGYNEFDEVVLSNSILVNYYILCNFGFEAGNADGYYLSGIFCADEGPAYPAPTRAGIKDNYQYELSAIVNIRKN